MYILQAAFCELTMFLWDPSLTAVPIIFHPQPWLRRSWVWWQCRVWWGGSRRLWLLVPCKYNGRKKEAMRKRWWQRRPKKSYNGSRTRDYYSKKIKKINVFSVIFLMSVLLSASVKGFMIYFFKDKVALLVAVPSHYNFTQSIKKRNFWTDKSILI